MKKWLAMVTLAAVLLAMTGSALAENADAPVKADELLGVWQSDDDDQLLVYMLPGSYSLVSSSSKAPELFAVGQWQETRERRLEYLMHVNERKEERNGFLDSLLGVSMSNAIQTLRIIGGGNAKDEDWFDCFDYSNANIDVHWRYGEDDEGYYPYTDKAAGTFFSLRADDGEIILYWVDEYDPHIPGIVLQRLSVEASAAEALTEKVLRPVIDMAAGAEVQTALALARWASEAKCMRMDGAALAENLRAAYAALSPADAQAFKDNYAKFTPAMLDALGLNPKTWSNPDRINPFKDAGLDAAILALANDIESQRSADVLNAAIEEIMK